MTDFATESGAQLLARIVSQQRPQLDRLDGKIFSNNGPHPREIVEISGETDSGKTTLLMSIMARVILPLEYGGKDGMVLFLVTDNNFNLIKFMATLEKYVRDSGTVLDTSTDIVDIVKTSLKNITFRRCFNAEQFELGIFGLNQSFATNHRYCLLAVDSIGAFYWNEVSASNKIRMDTYVKNILKKLISVIDDHLLVLVYTKPEYFLSNKSNGNANVSERIDYIIELSKELREEDFDLDSGSNFVYKCTTPKTNNTVLFNYDFDSFGINWKNE